jgi:bifunctional DNase/RNase
VDNRANVSLWLYVWRRVRKRLVYALFRHRWRILAGLAVVVGALGFLLVRGLIGAPAAALGVLPIAVSVQHLEPRGNTLPLILVEKGGSRQIVIRDLDSTEARVIARQQGMTFEGEQPQAYDLMRDLLQQVGGRVEHVVVDDGDRGQYVGRIVVSAGGETRAIRAKPADAVALALKTGAPIFVENAALDHSGVQGSR